LSIDKVYKNKYAIYPYVNIFWSNIANMIDFKREMIISTINNLQYLLEESKKVWNGEYIVNPHPVGTLAHTYFEVYVRSLIENIEINNVFDNSLHFIHVRNLIGIYINHQDITVRIFSMLFNKRVSLFNF
jgi:hypothetical protein